MEKIQDTKSAGRLLWSNKAEFVLSLVGYAVGLGNIWRFPYLCMRNGGGAFLIPYTFSLCFCGIPIYYLELYLGQFSSRSPTEVWNICPLLSGIGWGTIIYSGTTVFYVILMTWVLYFLYLSFTSVLPWSTCENDWNTHRCLDKSLLSLVHNDYHDNMVSPNASLRNDSVLLHPQSPAEEFFERKVLDISRGIEDLGGIKYDILLFYCISWFVLFLCLCKGVKSLGKVVYVTATAPYILLIALAVRGITLPGSMSGIKYFLVPDFAKLLDPKVWVEANLQVFYSLGNSCGGIIAMASYSKFNNKFYREAVGVPIINMATSVLGGIAIFSVIGFMAEQSGLAIDTVIRSGPGLAFVAYPEALAKMPGAPIWAVFFFITLITISIDTVLASVEAVTSGLEDTFPGVRKFKKTFTACVIFIMFLLGLPTTTRGGMYVFQVIDWYAGCLCLSLISLCECMVVVWLYGHKRFYYDVECMTGKRPSIYWKTCLCFTAPIMLAISMIFILTSMYPPYYGSYGYPWWAIVLGWVAALTSVMPLFISFVWATGKQPGSILKRIAAASRPNSKWGPAKLSDRVTYKYSTEYKTTGKLLSESV